MEYAYLAGGTAADVGVIQNGNQDVCPAYARQVHLKHLLWHALGLLGIVLLFLWDEALVSRLAQAADILGMERALIGAEEWPRDIDAHG
jgi:hypothetical protein